MTGHAMTGPACFAPPAPLTLGTVQLGQDYGRVVSNAMPGEAIARAVFDAAWAAGVTTFDTHRAYGLAEDRIGAWMRQTGRRPQIVTKIAPCTSEVELVASMRQSGEALGGLADGWLVPSRVLDIPEQVAALRGFREKGLIGTLGSSVYTPEEAARVMAVDDVRLLQIPSNILDRRFTDSGILQEAAERGVMVFVRSVFLQGVLLADPRVLPPHMASVAPVLHALRGLAAEAGVSLAALCFAAVRALPAVASVIVGVVSPSQLAEAVAAAGTEVPPEVLSEARRRVPDLPSAVLDPRQWP